MIKIKNFREGTIPSYIYVVRGAGWLLLCGGVGSPRNKQQQRGGRTAAKFYIMPII